MRVIVLATGQEVIRVSVVEAAGSGNADALAWALLRATEHTQLPASRLQQAKQIILLPLCQLRRHQESRLPQ